MKAKVTIVVPIYNVEKYISKCLTSLINQTFQDIEIMAVDDGSPDNSKEIVKKFAEKDTRIKLIVKNNGGYGSVLSYAVKNITTDYFIICDPDDWLATDAVEKLYNFAKKNDVDITVGDRFNVYTQDNTQEYISSKPGFIKVKPMQKITNLKEIQYFSFFLVSPHAKLYKTKLMKNIHFPNKVSYTDFILYLLGLANAKSVAYYNKALAYYLIDRSGNTTTDLRPKVLNDYLVGWHSAFVQITSINNENMDVLLYRLFYQLKFIMREYARIIKNKKFKDKYIIDIFNDMVLLQKYSKNIKKVRQDKGRGKLVMDGMLSKMLYKVIIKKFIKSKQ